MYEYTNKIYYDHFVLPFTIGLVVLLGYLCVKYYKWIKSFPREERKKIRKGLFSLKTIRSGWEIFRESLLHHNIFKTNPMLGYMHMTFAFGWFLLIVVGKIESMVYHTNAFNPPYFCHIFSLLSPGKRDLPVSANFSAFLGSYFAVPVDRNLVSRYQTFLLSFLRDEENHEATGVRLTDSYCTLVDFPGTFSSGKFHERIKWRW